MVRVLGWVLFWLLMVPIGLGAFFALVESESGGDVGKSEGTPALTYAERLDAQANLIQELEASSFTGSLLEIGIALGVIQAAAEILEEGEQIDDLPQDVEAARASALRNLSRKQVQIFPTLRDAFGPHLRKELWIDDASARTIGPGFRTIEFVSADFAANRNIQEAHREVVEQLYRLRFTRAQYKWFKQALELSYYDMIPPPDGTVVVWIGALNWREVEIKP